MPREGSAAADCGYLGGAVRAAPSGDRTAADRPAQAGRSLRADVRRLAFFTTAALLLGIAVAGAGAWWLTRPVPPSVVRSTLITSGSTALVLSPGGPDVAITPDGSRVVYRRRQPLLVRALDELEPTVLSGPGAPGGDFTSPDGHSVGFSIRPACSRKSPSPGGRRRPCARSRHTAVATWRSDGTIIFTTTPRRQVCSAWPLQEASHRAHDARSRARGSRPAVARVLPGGETVLSTITSVTGGIETAQIAVLDLRTRTSEGAVSWRHPCALRTSGILSTA